MAQKANINDIGKAVSEITCNLESKISFEDLQTILKDYIGKSEVLYLLSTKVSLDEVRQLLETKMNQGELRRELNTLSQKVDDVYKEISKKGQRYVKKEDFEVISSQLEQKASLIDFQEL